MHLNEQITEVLFLEKDVSRQLQEKWHSLADYYFHSAWLSRLAIVQFGRRHHLIRLQSFADDRLFKSLKNRRLDLLAEIACLDSLWKIQRMEWYPDEVQSANN